jgi:hypothetical protein
MAKIQQDIVVLKVSKIVRDKESDDFLIADIEFLKSIEQVAQELLGESVVVEIERMDEK